MFPSVPTHPLYPRPRSFSCHCATPFKFVFFLVLTGGALTYQGSFVCYCINWGMSLGIFPRPLSSSLFLPFSEM